MIQFNVLYSVLFSLAPFLEELSQTSYDYSMTLGLSTLHSHMGPTPGALVPNLLLCQISKNPRAGTLQTCSTLAKRQRISYLFGFF